jgi:hypothetical protein
LKQSEIRCPGKPEGAVQFGRNGSAEARGHLPDALGALAKLGRPVSNTDDECRALEKLRVTMQKFYV